MAVARIARELKAFGTPTDASDIELWCPEEDNMMHLLGLVWGPKDTAYSFGVYFVDIKCPDDFPMQPPKATWLATAEGNTRMGPNLYSNGKVCLSVLNTYAADAGTGPGWTAAIRMEAVLLAVQSLLTDDPYHNEPGFEQCAVQGNFAELKGRQEPCYGYAMKIRHESIRLGYLVPLACCLGVAELETVTASTLASMRSPLFTDYMSGDPSRVDRLRRRLLASCDAVRTCCRELAALDGRHFEYTRFENVQNGAGGTYHFAGLARDVERLRVAAARGLAGPEERALHSTPTPSTQGASPPLPAAAARRSVKEAVATHSAATKARWLRKALAIGFGGLVVAATVRWALKYAK